MATLEWPTSSEAALGLSRYPLNFVACVACGHIFNESFMYVNVPYSEKPNLMFNRGINWSLFLKDLGDDLLALVENAGTVVEIGYGDGSFLDMLAQSRSDVRCIGFDPHGATTDSTNAPELRQELFIAQAHIAELRPQLIISRHVLEHLENPLGFVEQLEFAASWHDLEVYLYIEVPCVDNAVKFGRTVDFYYEHNSQFTTDSFTKMLERSGLIIEKISHGYNGEIVSGLCRTSGNSAQVAQARHATEFRLEAAERAVRLSAQIDELADNNVAIWGGTGKAAAFINSYGLDAARFPVVVDSDPEKAGTFVPGTGQRIEFRDHLKSHPAAIVVIPAHWRALDIVKEMQRESIAPDRVLIEHEGQLVDFHTGQHPYGNDHALAG